MTHRSLRLLAPLLFAAALPVFAYAQVVATPTAAQPVASPLETSVEALAAKYLAKPGGAGLSIAIARRGEVVLAKGYGFADLEFDVKADENTLFRIGSVTKQFTAALVMQQIERKKLALDDELSQYVPGFPLQGNKVTIRQLLNHTSGIPSYTDIGEEWHKVWPLELTDDELLALVKDKPFDFEPGTRWAYNNTGYYLLGMVLEKVTGKSFEKLVVSEISKPLKLDRTRADSNVDLIKNRAQGYALKRSPLGNKVVNDQVLGTSQPGAAGMLLSTARELVLWQIALTSGKFVSPESFALMRTSTITGEGSDTGYGFGLMIGEYEGHKRVQHGGGIFGFNSMLVWYPDDDLHIAVISNGEPVSSAAIADDLVWLALGIERPAVKDEPIPAEKLALLAGNYVVEALGMDTEVSTADGKLYAQAKAPGQAKFRLQWQGGDEFRADFDPNVIVRFSADGQSFRLLQGGGTFEGRRKP
ncbi:MAG: serine hydrolase [Planctomycetes bacterium]|nr:serine hydrolase [Planctomycetota bacterium]